MSALQEQNDSGSCEVSAKECRKIIDGIIERLRDRGMRRSDALEALLSVMLKRHKPFSLAELGESPELEGRDQATIYRLVNKLKELGVVRQLSLGERASWFQLDLPNHHHDYIVCRECGTLSEVPVTCVVHKVESELAKRLGWRDLSHSLLFQGTCPACV
ncbi:MAG: transcriptional repressor [Verrucomicrobiota bacterium]